MSKQTALVTVTTKCTCGAARWFSCTCAEVVAEYDCALFDDVAGVPHPKQVALIQREHPDCEFRYLSLGAEHQRAIAAEYARL